MKAPVHHGDCFKSTVVDLRRCGSGVMKHSRDLLGFVHKRPQIPGLLHMHRPCLLPALPHAGSSPLTGNRSEDTLSRKDKEQSAPLGAAPPSPCTSTGTAIYRVARWESLPPACLEAFPPTHHYLAIAALHSHPSLAPSYVFLHLSAA